MVGERCSSLAGQERVEMTTSDRCFNDPSFLFLEPGPPFSVGRSEKKGIHMFILGA